MTEKSVQGDTSATRAKLVGKAMRDARKRHTPKITEFAPLVGLDYSTISSNESGSQMAPDSTLIKYEQVLGLEHGSLLNLKHEVTPTARENVPLDPQELPLAAVDDDGEPPAGRFWRSPIGWVLRIMLVTGLPLLFLYYALAFTLSGLFPAPKAAPDHTSSTNSRCAVDAFTSASVDALLPDGTQFGVIELRSSRSCLSSWARFVPLPERVGMPGVDIEVQVHRYGLADTTEKIRAAPQARSTQTETYAANKHCVIASAVLFQDGKSTYTKTPCLSVTAKRFWSPFFPDVLN